jgi:hypothetical protein
VIYVPVAVPTRYPDFQNPDCEIDGGLNMTLNAQNLVAWHDRTTANHVAERDKFADMGFRPLSLSIYGSPSDPRYAAVMVPW